MTGGAEPPVGRTAGALLGAAFLLATVASPAGAQEDVAAAERGWIGVGLTAEAECAAAGRAPCGPAVVGSVILGGPAERAGIQPGDTLLALGGSAVERGPADPAFRQLRAGDSLRVRVARDGERLSLRIVPRSRPDSLAVVRLQTPRPAGAPPAPDGREPPRPGVPGGGYGLALPEAVRPSGEPPVVRVIPVGGSGDISRVLVNARTEALREAMEEARSDMTRPQRDLATARRLARELEVQAARMAAEQWRTWLDDSLRVRLDALHDSVLARAREQLEAVVEARARARPEAAGRRPALRSTSRDRIAGAEMEGLNPELSEFFGGLESGILILRVLPQTPAAELGLRPGDVIVEAGGRAVSGVGELRSALQAADQGAVEVKWVRKGTELTGHLQR